MHELKKIYNDIAKKQLYYFNLMKEKFNEFNNLCEQERLLSTLSESDYLSIKELKRQEFEQNMFGLSQEEFQGMQKVRDLSKEVMDELLSNGITMTGKEIKEGFEVII